MPEEKVYATTMVAFLMLLLVLSTVSMANAAAGITLDPTTGEPEDSVQVTGTDFGASTPVGIGFGAEVVTTDSNMSYSGTGVGPYSGKVSYWPIKPGSFVLTADTTMSGGIISTYTDNGDGTLSGSFEGAYGDINYTTGEWSRTSTVDLTGYEQIYSASYTRYEWNVTPAEGLISGPDGAFTTNITVPMLGNGSCPITAIDEEGNMATADFTVYGSEIPEIISFGSVLLLTSIVAVIATFSFRKRIRIRQK